MNIDWKDAPEWAMWLSIDICDGARCWWSKEPYQAWDMFLLCDGEYTHPNARVQLIDFVIYDDHSWGLLEARPCEGV